MSARKRWWGGFVDGELALDRVKNFGGHGDDYIRRPAIFSNKQEAQREYEDVRPLTIAEEMNT